MRRYIKSSKRSLALLKHSKQSLAKGIGRKKKSTGLVWQKAPDIKKRLNSFKNKLSLDFLNLERIFVYRSFNSSSKAYARTWGFPRIWQISLSQEPAYVIEVISEKFDKLLASEQDKVLLHELAHIPKNFSGSLLPHIRHGKRSFHNKVKELIIRHLNLSGK